MKVLVIGSGPIVIGQAAEFDYAGTQACKSLREEGHSVVLVNSNPATIMTDPGVSDALYIEPLNVDFLERVIARELPDALLPTLGGQTGLNLATQLADEGIIDKYGMKVLGTPLSAIRRAEDREQFRDLMREIKEPVPESWIIRTEEELDAILSVAPYPCIIRPAYTLGGTGGGVASTKEELWEIGRKGLKLSMRSMIMVERSLLGWKEVEYEVMRDRIGTCITVCNMENLDPMGVHTGDSIVVAPSQTLSDLEYHMLRTASLKIIQALGIEGGCNVQLAVNPESFDYYIIEVNPRVSRSSALASKATGYPIARVAAKIAIGKTLDEIENEVTGTTKACFEPALDYCVVKIPRWPFDKFASGDRSLFTQMKATGEVMAIDRSFEAAFMKAIRGLEVKQKDLRHAGMQALDDVALKVAIAKPTDERLWALAEGLRRGWSVSEVNQLSKVDPWFLRKMENLLNIEQRLVNAAATFGRSEDLANLIHEAFLIGFPSPTIDSLLGNVNKQKAHQANTAEMREQLHMSLSDRPETLAHMLAIQDFVENHDLNDKTKRPEDTMEAYMSKRLAAFPEYQEQLKATQEKLAANPSFLVDEMIAKHPEMKEEFANHRAEIDRVRKQMEPQFALKREQALLERESNPKPTATSDAPMTGKDYREYVSLAASLIELQKVMPVFKMVDTCAGEFESHTPYYYGTFETEDDALPV